MRPSNQPNPSPTPAPSVWPAAVAPLTSKPANDPACVSNIAGAVELIPTGAFVLTSAYGETRAGVIVRWVQRVSSAPHLVVVAIEKGQPLSPIIRDSRRFALCQLAAEDRVLHRIFEPERADAPRPPQGSRFDPVDPFLGLPTRMTATGVPILLKSLAWLECELTRHLDVEGNCELYIGLVHDGGVLRAPDAAPTTPAVAGNGHTNGHANGHAHGRSNGHSNGQTNGHATPRSRRPAENGTNGAGVTNANGRGNGGVKPKPSPRRGR